MWLFCTNNAIGALLFETMDIVSVTRVMCLHIWELIVTEGPDNKIFSVDLDLTHPRHTGQSAASAGFSKRPAQHLWTSVE